MLVVKLIMMIMIMMIATVVLMNTEQWNGGQ